MDPSPEVGLIFNRLQYERFKWNDDRLKNVIRKYKKNLFESNKKETVQNVNTAEEEGYISKFPVFAHVQKMRDLKKTKRKTLIIIW